MLIENEIQNSQKYNLTKTGELIDLTEDNVAKVEAMIRYDSTYKNSSNPKLAPIIIQKKGSNKKKIKYKGSTAYHIEQLSNYWNNKATIDKEEYRNLIQNIIEAIDRDNSTHINSDSVGIEQLTNIVCQYDKTKLLELLKNPKPNYELITKLSQKTTPPVSYGKNKNGKNYLKHPARKNFSFATKFCHYMAAKFFKGEEQADNFSIYDNVLNEAVRKYKDDIDPNSIHKKKLVFDGQYVIYINFIDDIIKEHECKISRNGFDHLLWYSYKGDIE